MNISQAIELMHWTTPKSPARMVEMAENFLDHCRTDTPLRYKVAAQTIIKHYRL